MERKDYKRYSREFKLEAVRLASFGEKPKARIARAARPTCSFRASGRPSSTY
jgi:transposase-like protein